MRKFKLICSVPQSHAESVRMAIGAAGGGDAGEYTYCSFTTTGTGRFLPGDLSKPFSGKHGEIEEALEERIEIGNIPQSKIKPVIDALLEVHPYDEAYYELVEIFFAEDLV